MAPKFADVRVVWANARDPNMSLKSLFNPQQLGIRTAAHIGEIGPIGWSSTTQQFSRTMSPDIPIELYFSEHAFFDFGLPFPSFEHSADFFRSFLYGPAPGIAPSHILLVWPGVATIIAVVKDVDVRFTRFDLKMHAMEYTVSMNLKEARQTFISAKKISGSHGPGMQTPDAELMSPGATRNLSGAPLVNVPSPLSLHDKSLAWWKNGQ